MQHGPFCQGLVLATALTLCAASEAAGQRKPPGPTVPYVDAGACPFEGCAYGEWVSTDTVRVRRERDRRSSPVFELTKGEKVTAVTGAVVVLRAGRVTFTTGARLSSQEGVLKINAGETLYLLSYIGEGFTNAWFHRASNSLATGLMPRSLLRSGFFGSGGEWQKAGIYIKVITFRCCSIMSYVRRSIGEWYSVSMSMR